MRASAGHMFSQKRKYHLTNGFYSSEMKGHFYQWRVGLTSSSARLFGEREEKKEKNLPGGDPVLCFARSPDRATNTHVSGYTQESFSLPTTEIYRTKRPCFAFSQREECLSLFALARKS